MIILVQFRDFLPMVRNHIEEQIHNTPWKFINISILHLIAVPLFTLIELYWLLQLYFKMKS